MPRPVPALAVLLAVSAAACSDRAGIPTAPAARIRAAVASSRTDDAEPGLAVAHAHISELRNAPGDASKGRGGGGGGGGGGGTGIFFHGGPVLQGGTNVVAVYWAASTIYNGGPAAGTTGAGSADGSNIGYFLSHLGGSPYFNINSTYTDGAGAHIANSVTYTGFWANNQNVPVNGANVSDGAIVAMLQSGLDAGAITYDASTVYAVFTAGTVNLGGGFGTQYCAYHWFGTVTVGGASKTILYAAMPFDLSFPSGCTSGLASPNADPAADAEVNTLGHEVEEATTDPLGTAWFDHRGFENADKCAWKFGTTYSNGIGIANMKLGTKDFLVQMNWVNAGRGGCLLAF